MNTGCWGYQPHFLSAEPNRSPYWPGTAIRVEDDGPPRARCACSATAGTTNCGRPAGPA